MSRTLIFVLMMVWLCALGVGLRSMTQYENTPGTAASPAATWRHNPLLVPQQGKPTLIMLAHPRCPCTRASIAELRLLATHCPDKAQICVLFFVPQNAAPDWTQTELWKSAAAIPGVTLLQDTDGAEAKYFHAETSGETLLYDANGSLRFHGGITASRGHEGSNAGRAALESLLNKGESAIRQTPVFGCSLHRAAFPVSQGGESCRK